MNSRKLGASVTHGGTTMSESNWEKIRLHLAKLANTVESASVGISEILKELEEARIKLYELGKPMLAVKEDGRVVLEERPWGGYLARGQLEALIDIWKARREEDGEGQN